jgi:hypothetical protein
VFTGSIGEEALQVRTKKRVKSAAQVRIMLPEATFVNQCCMDFVSERLAEGRWFRILMFSLHHTMATYG